MKILKNKDKELSRYLYIAAEYGSKNIFKFLTSFDINIDGEVFKEAIQGDSDEIIYWIHEHYGNEIKQNRIHFMTKTHNIKRYEWLTKNGYSFM